MGYQQTKLDWNDVEIGHKYKYEEEYEIQAEVTVLSKVIDQDWIGFTLRVDKGFYGCDDGQPIECGKTTNPKFSYIVNDMNFLTLDSWFSYQTPGFNGID